MRGLAFWNEADPILKGCLFGLTDTLCLLAAFAFQFFD